MLDMCAKKIIDLYYADYKFFFSKPNVVGIGYGCKITNGVKTYEPSIQVFVENKIHSNSMNKCDMIPSLYKGIKTDVIKSGKFITGTTLSRKKKSVLRANTSYIDKVRPIQPGWCMSIDFIYYLGGNNFTGTFGYIVTDNKGISNTYCLLSVNATFADWNNYPEGGPILQPSYEYGGRAPQDVVATLLRYAPLKFSLLNSTAPLLSEMNIIDASVASFLVKSPVELINPFIPPNNVVPTNIMEPSVGLGVNWTGCLTGSESGKITSINAILKAEYTSLAFGNRLCWFKDASLIPGNTVSDDYGALVYNRAEEKINAIGMLFTESSISNHVALCSIKSIQEILDITLVL